MPNKSKYIILNHTKRVKAILEQIDSAAHKNNVIPPQATIRLQAPKNNFS